MQNKIYVGNLNTSANDAQLREFFQAYGNITEIAIPVDKYNGQARGFAFITFQTQSEAQAAVEKANGMKLLDRALKVNIAQDREKTGGSGGRSSGGRSSGSRW